MFSILFEMKTLPNFLMSIPVPNNIIFPFYHLVADATPPHISALYKARTPDQFRKDIEKLLRNFSPITLKTIHQHQKKGTPPQKRSFYLTFDDGLKECYTTIAPILREYSLEACFFVNPNFVDNKDMMFRYKQSLIVENMKKQQKQSVEGFSRNEITQPNLNDAKRLDEIANQLDFSFSQYLEDHQPYMTSSQIQELQNEGHIIGAHSMTHPFYENLTLATQLKETKQSIDWVQKYFPSHLKTFAFPFTDFGVSRSFFESMENSMDVCFTTAGVKKDLYPWVFNRFSMEKHSLENALTKYTLKSFFHFRNINRHYD